MTLEQNPLSPVQADEYVKKSNNKKIWKWFLAILIITLVAWLIYGKIHQSAQKLGKEKFNPSNMPIPVLIAKPIQRDVNVYLDSLGTVSPRNTVAVTSLVTGHILKLFFNEGQMVKKGQILALIDTRPFEIQLAQAEGQLFKDKALLDNALLDLDRYKTLIGQSSISKQTLDTQDSLVRQYQGAVAIDQSQFDNAKLQLSYCHINSPITGRIGLRQVDPGNIIQSSNAIGIATITQLQPITALFSIPEDDLPAVTQRMKSNSKIVIDAFDRGQKLKLATGTLLTTDNLIDTTTGSIKMRALFNNEDNTLFPNQFVNIKLLVDVQKNTIVIPMAALQHGKNGDYVYVVNQDNTVTLRPVKSGSVDGESISITQGVNLDDSVVIDGIDKLRDGSKVKLTTPIEADRNTSGKLDHTKSRNKANWHKKQSAE